MGHMHHVAMDRSENNNLAGEGWEVQSHRGTMQTGKAVLTGGPGKRKVPSAGPFPSAAALCRELTCVSAQDRMDRRRGDSGVLLRNRTAPEVGSGSHQGSFQPRLITAKVFSKC